MPLPPSFCPPLFASDSSRSVSPGRGFNWCRSNSSEPHPVADETCTNQRIDREIELRRPFFKSSARGLVLLSWNSIVLGSADDMRSKLTWTFLWKRPPTLVLRPAYTNIVLYRMYLIHFFLIILISEWFRNLLQHDLNISKSFQSLSSHQKRLKAFEESGH